ncbi:MAG: sigma-70 family RNA polymerase sigma factor [Bacteroidetes bacterium]|nr:MAG: sigma-70 family RNA polymerase sigma factor [Bacteroidota bacterium]
MQQNLQETITRSLEGNQEAFRSLVDHYQQPAFTLAFRILCDEEEAKDAVQEGFIKVWSHLNRYDKTQPFSSWLFRIIANCSIDRVRKIRRRNEITLEQIEITLERIRTEDPGTTLDNQEIARLIRFLASGLPEKQQLVFILRDIQGMDSAEVKEVLGIPDTLIKSNLYHARKSIREKLEKIYSMERRQL